MKWRVVMEVTDEDHCHRRSRCQRCEAARPMKDKRSRRLLTLFGTVNVSAPRFEPRRCAVTCRQTLSPVSEIMPDRCTPEYERIVAKMGASLPYRRARTLLAAFLPLDDIPSVETARQRTIGVGARLEKAALGREKTADPSPVDAGSVAIFLGSPGRGIIGARLILCVSISPIVHRPNPTQTSSDHCT